MNDNILPQNKEESPKDRGRNAESPLEIPRRGWWDVIRRVLKESNEDKINFQAAGVSFYFLLALIPALSAVAGIYGLVADPFDVVEQLTQLRGLIPWEAYDLLERELTGLTTGKPTSAVKLAFGLLLAVWGATKGVEALMDALNTVYDEKETRGFFHRKLLIAAVTLGGALMMVAMIALFAALPAVVKIIPMKRVSETLLVVARWPVIFVVAITALAVVYRVIPCRRSAKWRWVTPGSLLVTALWVPASIALTFYGGEIGSRSASYGSIAAVILLMLWFYITVLLILLGGELNAEAEHQTAVDSTIGETKPIGERGAYVADTLGEIKK
jgi:membrane protein